ncbi:hypothetical protein NDU88_002508 [Pleurodeles waltl]|uniref:Uncharacterized protein n=1 Tax=Pleurodeles waltl TaxID=8319 RepID=A0AAV7W317_PLEWA|nr:hypothetical protein NDU88_002508 [Pleurodeles waltl]
MPAPGPSTRRREGGILSPALLSIGPSPGAPNEQKTNGQKTSAALLSTDRGEVRSRSKSRDAWRLSTVRREFTGSALAGRHVPLSLTV